jgi:hypothetical protein
MLKFLTRKQRRVRAYRAFFNSPYGKIVLADLKKFCRPTLPTADVNNPNVTFLREGRREVWLRINAHMNLTEEDIQQIAEDYEYE